MICQNKLQIGIEYMQEGKWEEAAKTFHRSNRRKPKRRSLDTLTLGIY